MSYHISPTWHEWNVNSDDVMQTWFALYVNPSDIMLTENAVKALSRLLVWLL